MYVRVWVMFYVYYIWTVAFFDEQRKDLDTNTVNSYRMYFKMFIRPYYCQTILYNILLYTIQVLQ